MLCFGNKIYSNLGFENEINEFLLYSMVYNNLQLNIKCNKNSVQYCYELMKCDGFYIGIVRNILYQCLLYNIFPIYF